MKNNRPEWLYNETKHVGVDYGSLEQAHRYDEMHQSFRDYEGNTKTIINHLGLGKDSTVIDIGTGTGAFAIHAAKYCKHVYAVDISEAMLERCKAKAERANLKNISCCVGGFLTYKHDSEPADAAVSLIALHHLPDFWKLVGLKRVSNMLKDQGRLLLFDILFPSELEDLDIQLNNWIESITQRAGHQLAAETEMHIRDEYSTYDWVMEGLLQHAGFRIDNSEYSGFQATYLCTKQ